MREEFITSLGVQGSCFDSISFLLALLLSGLGVLSRWKLVSILEQLQAREYGQLSKTIK